MKFGTDIHNPQKMNCNSFDPLTFSGAIIKIVICPILYDQIPANPMTFPSASVVLCVGRYLANV